MRSKFHPPAAAISQRSRKFYIHAIEEGKYQIRVDGFQVFYSTDEGEARRMINALNEAFADVIDETESLQRQHHRDKDEAKDLLS